MSQIIHSDLIVNPVKLFVMNIFFPFNRFLFPKI